MAKERDDTTTTTTTTTTTSRRLRPRLVKRKEEDEEASPPRPKTITVRKRKAPATTEDLYLQKKYKPPQPTPLETVFESPQPARSQRRGAAASSLMGQRRLHRRCAFDSHYNPPPSKCRRRRDGAQRMKQLTGVCLPQGKAFTDDDVTAALSCLAEDEVAAPSLPQDTGEGQGVPHTPAADTLTLVTDVLGSLQMECECPVLPCSSEPHEAPQEMPLALPNPPRKQRRRSGLVVVPSLTLASIPMDQQPQEPLPQDEGRKKRTPDTSPVTVKKQCIPQAPAAAADPPSHPRRNKGRRRVSGIKRSLYHTSITSSPDHSPSRTPSPPAITPTTHTPPSPLTPTKRDCSLNLLDSPKCG